MRASKLLLPTLKETPADAEIVSHQLMLRTGMIRQVAAGIYNWLPLGLRVLQKVKTIVREEMNNAGAQELFLPAVQPAELWRESGRWEQYGPELLRLKDRHQREFCIGPTHEEVITNLVRNDIKSYRQLPLNLYQIQTKFRDEIRPRFGIMRCREFIMKDAYSFHIDNESFLKTYDDMYAAYTRIFERCGLEFRAVEADSGAIGGNASHEFHVLADSGEDAIAICEKHDYAANVELTPALAPADAPAAPTETLGKIDTPGVRSIDDLCKQTGAPPSRTLKTLLVRGTGGPVALVLRGDHELNLVKTQKLPQVASPLKFLDAAEIRAAVGGEPGSIGPKGLDIPVIADHSAAALADFLCGANVKHVHYTGVNWGRDLNVPETADIRKVVAGDLCPATGARADDPDARLTIKRGIEVGHIFQLGTKYSESMHATCLDEAGKAVSLIMGCYGIGVTRVVAAAIEQNHDKAGIIWPDAIAPFEVAIVPIGMRKSEQVAKTAKSIYKKLKTAGIDVLLDDRDERPGVMFAEIELIGIPHRLVIGERGLKQGNIEYKHRTSDNVEELPLDSVVEILGSLTATLAV